jgi:hypothetical protein
MLNKKQTVTGLALAGLLMICGAGAADASQVTPNYTEYGGGSTPNTPSGLIGSVNDFSAAGSYFYGDTISAALGGTALTGAPTYGFYEDFEFTIGNGNVDSITSTIALGNISSISNLQVRLYNAAGNPVLPVLGTPSHTPIDAWSTSSNSPNYTIDVIPTTMLTVGTYILEVRGLVTGSTDGSYSGTLDVNPVPLPAALPLMISALSGLGLWSRRRTPRLQFRSA